MIRIIATDTSTFEANGVTITGPITADLETIQHGIETYNTGCYILQANTMTKASDLHPMSAAILPAALLAFFIAGINFARKCFLIPLLLFVVSTLQAQAQTYALTSSSAQTLESATPYPRYQVSYTPYTEIKSSVENGVFESNYTQVSTNAYSGSASTWPTPSTGTQTITTSQSTIFAGKSRSFPYRLELGVQLSIGGTVVWKKPIKWISASTSGNPNKTGAFDGDTAIDANGDPVDYEGTPTPTEQGHTLPNRINNDETYPAAYWWTMKDENGNLLASGETPLLGPGEGWDQNFEHSAPFDVEYGPIYDGVNQPATGGGSSEPTGSPPVTSSPQVSSTAPPTSTSPLTTPPKSTDPDGTKDAVDRVGDIITVYGEHGRTTSNAANRALQELIELNKTGNAKSQEQVDALEEIAQTQGPDGTYTGGEAHDATGSVDTTNATDLLAKIEAIVNRIKNLDYDFTVGYGTSDLIWTIPTPIGEKVINLTAFATFFLICRSLILAQLSISFVFSIVTTMKGAFS